MSKLLVYQGIFNNHYFHNKEVVITNDGETLSFLLDVFRIESEFGDFLLVEFDNHEPEELERFKVKKCPLSYSNDFHYILRDYTLEIELPISLIEVASQNIIQVKSLLKFIVGKPEAPGALDDVEFAISLQLNGTQYSSSSIEFEYLLLNLLKSIGDKYRLRHCIDCLFSDYWPAGNQVFGDMMCFRKHKEQYLKVKSKSDIFILRPKSEEVQEIHSCDEFEMRVPGTGYRG